MEHHIAIIGVGPRGTYCFRRLTLYLKKHPLKCPVNIHLVEKSGKFGGGGIHSTTQPDYLLLNTIGTGDRVHPHVCVIGISVEGKFWFNAADARPDVNSNAIAQLSKWVEDAVSRLKSKEKAAS